MPPIDNGEFICIELITRPLCSVAAVVDSTRHHYLGLRVMLAAAFLVHGWARTAIHLQVSSALKGMFVMTQYFTFDM